MPSSPRPHTRIPEAGEIVAAKYRVVRKIAEGGMGVVVEAMHIQLEQRVAIKFLRPDTLGNGAANDVTARFLREARAALKIRSEHIVRVYDASVLENEVPYIVMELLEGQDLDRLLEENGAFPIADTIDYVLQAAEALAEAHSLGIVHRDLKPANMFLLKSASGVPMIKVLDFGISKDATVAGATLSLTSAHAVLGSPSYMSPEQMRSTKDVDARADIWALGVILYELLTGRLPFNGETMPQVCSSILEDVPMAPSRLRSQIPMAVEKAILKCLEKRAEDRFADVAALGEALAPFGTEIGAESARRTARAMNRTSGSSFAPRFASPSLAALATTNKRDDSPTQAVETWSSIGGGRSSRRRYVLIGVGWAFGLTLVASSIVVATRKPWHRAGAPAAIVSTATPASPPEPAETMVPSIVVAPVAATAKAVDPPASPPTADAPPPRKALAPPPPGKPRATKAAAVPSSAPGASGASTAPAPTASAPADPANAVSWDERK